MKAMRLNAVKTCVSAAAIAAALAPALAAAQAGQTAAAEAASARVIEGVVTDVDGNIPLRGVVVRIAELGRVATTGTDGRFRFDGVAPGEYVLEFSYLNSGIQRSSVAVSDAAGAAVTVALGSGDDRDTIIVTGNRGSLASARAQELASDQFKTIVSADAIGNFADQNVAESLQRLPGLSIRRNEGEGQQVAVRGLSGSFVSVTVDGARVGTRDIASRSVNLDVISSDLLNGIEVTKTLTPDLEADSVAGSVNLRTLSAFDRNKNSLNLRAEVGYQDKSKDYNPKFSGDFTRILGGNDQFGIAGGVSWSNRKSVVDDFRVDNGLRYITDSAGNRFLSPRVLDQRNDPAERTRISGTLNLEFRPDSDNRLFLRGTYAAFRDQDIRAREQFELDDATTFGPSTGSAARITNISATGGRFVRIDEEKRFRFTDQRDELLTLSMGSEHLSGGWKFNWQADYSVNNSDIPSLEARFRERDVIVEYSDLSIDGVTISPLPNAARNADPSVPGNFTFRRITSYDFFIEDQIISVKADIERQFLLGGQDAKLKFGVKYFDREKDVAVDRANLGQRTLAVASNNLGLFDPRVPTNTNLNFGFFPDLAALNTQTQAWAAQALASGDFTIDEAINSGNDWIGREKVWSAYAMGTVDLSSRLQVIAGVRMEHTDWITSGNSLETNDLSNDVTALLRPALQAALNAGTATFTAAELAAYAARPETTSVLIPRLNERNSYTDFFPSLHFRYEPSSNVLMRLSFTTALQRPDFDEATAISRIRTTETTETLIDGGQLVVPTVLNSLAAADALRRFRREADDLRNPQLEALKARQIDASIAWYPSKDVFVQAAGFYKDITNFIVPVTFTGNSVANLGFTPGTEFEPAGGGVFAGRTYINGDKATVYGVELSYQHFFRSLPGVLSGLFVNANATLSKSSARDAVVGRTFTLPDQSDVVGNVSLGWENDAFSIRWSGNYSGERLVELNGGFLGLADEASDILERSRFSMDVNVRWDITKTFQIYFDANNINGAQDRAFFRAGIYSRIEDYGATYQAGVRARF